MPEFAKTNSSFARKRGGGEVVSDMMLFDSARWSRFLDWLQEPGHQERLAAYIDQEVGSVHFAQDYEKERGPGTSSSDAGQSFWRPNDLNQQRARASEIWPELGPVPSAEALLAPYVSNGLHKAGDGSVSALPSGEHGFFLTPKIDEMVKLARLGSSSDYHRVRARLFWMLRGCSGVEFGDQGLSQRDEERPLHVWWSRRRKYEAGIPGKFVVYAGQSGRAYFRWSMRAARAHMERDHGSRVGITSIDGAQMILMHPRNRPGYLGCAGTERAVSGGECFSGATAFYEFQGNIVCNYVATEGRSGLESHGSASFCFPERFKGFLKG